MVGVLVMDMYLDPKRYVISFHVSIILVSYNVVRFALETIRGLRNKRNPRYCISII